MGPKLCTDFVLSGAAFGEPESHSEKNYRVNEEIWKQSLYCKSAKLTPISDEIRGGFDSKFGPFDSTATASEVQFRLSIQQHLQTRIKHSLVFLFNFR